MRQHAQIDLAWAIMQIVIVRCLSVTGHCSRDPRDPGCSETATAVEVTAMGTILWEFRYPGARP